MSRPSRRWLWIVLLGLILAGVARLRFDIEVLNLLPADAPAVQGLKLYQQNFSNARELILTVRGPDADTAQNAARALADSLRAAAGLAAEVTWQPPWMEHPDQAAELAAYLWLNQPPAICGSLTNRLLGGNVQRTLQSTRAQLSTSFSPADIARLGHDPFDLLKLPPTSGSANAFEEAQDMFASADGTFRLVFVRALDDLRDYRTCAKWLASIRKQVRDTPLPQGVVIGYTGRPVFVSEIAGGMERDINSSMGSTLLIIVLLFWWAHRAWRPLLWLLSLLVLILAGTLALGGLLLGTLNVVSAGFAAILLGLAVDYGLVLYEEHRAAPGQSAPQIRREIAPSIIWSAATTAGAFFMLPLGGLPGLGQLGLLVGIGVSLAAVVMLYGFLPPLLSAERKRPLPTPPAPKGSVGLGPRMAGGLTLILLLLAGGLVWWRPPVLDHSPEPLRPRHSSAYETLQEIRTQMKQDREPLWLVLAGRTEQQVADRLDQVLSTLTAARNSGAVEDFTLPASLWPHPGFQAANRNTIQKLLPERDALAQAAQAQGFRPESMATTDRIFQTWKAALASEKVFWPTNQLSQWVLSKFTAQTNGQWLALGLIYPANSTNATVSPGQPTTPPSMDWTRDLPPQGVWLAGWGLLGTAILDVVQHDLWRVLLPMATLLLLSLWFAFRRGAEMLLSLAVLAFSGLCLLAIMSLANWSWNLLNLTAIPLLLGAGVDYTLHVQLALRRHSGDLALVRRVIGRALLLCAGTTCAGFGSLAWSSNGGLASLGAVCATGLGLTYLISVYLLPAWWQGLVGASPPSRRRPKADELDAPGVNAPPPYVPGYGNPPKPPSPIGPEKAEVRAFPASGGPSQSPGGARQPSWLYRTDLWRLGHWAAQHLPQTLIDGLGHLLAGLYWRLNRRRRETVIQNLLPALGGERDRAEATSRELFHHFAGKLIDLWRYESGLPIDHLICELCGWDHFLAAQKRGGGILLLTAHLGNWELGAPLLAAHGVKLTVITLVEPDAKLTELRKQSRSRWGIETLVIGDNPFAFVDVIRRLDGGGAVALLMDRPPAPSATTTQLFGRPFQGSISAAELARASGCALLPVCIVRTPSGYRAEVLPEIIYDRPALGSRDARQKLTQQIVRVFEPLIQQYLAQWYHFVSIWPED